MAPNPPADAKYASDLNARLEAERAGRPFLLYTDADHRQQLFVFDPGSASASVGRLPSSDLLIDWDSQVSRLHARFERTADQWELVDDGFSSNGTFVNGQRLSGRRRLNDGDSLRIGSTTITFRAPAPDQSRQANAADAPAAVTLSTTQRRVLIALCRPYKGRSGFASPATDQQIADELFISVGAVRTHLKVLYAKFEISQLSQHETRVRLVELAFSGGLVSESDL